jgi:uncharacterized damage-inducible protein DinB
MHRRHVVHLIALTLCLTSASAVSGQAPAGAAAAPATPKPATGFRAEFLRELDGTQDYYLRLAEVIPADKYTWRPAEGVRSVSEVFLHVATANYTLPRRLGTPMPTGFQPNTYEKSTTDKSQVIAALRESFAHLRGAVERVSDADADKSFPWFTGGENTYRGLLLFITKHSGEHLGQSIAYARMIGVKPPWSD